MICSLKRTTAAWSRMSLATEMEEEVVVGEVVVVVVVVVMAGSSEEENVVEENDDDDNDGGISQCQAFPPALLLPLLLPLLQPMLIGKHSGVAAMTRRRGIIVAAALRIVGNQTDEVV